MGFKEQVEQILSQRKVFLEKINRDKEKVSKIQSDFYVIKKDLDAIGSNGINAEAIRPEVEQAIRKIDNAIEIIGRMEKRFRRDTVNIGVAGPARVGKSTFLQSMTGLTDEQIPSGSGLPVTAVRSQIFNQQPNSESYALIEFFDEQEFIKNRVDPYTELIKNELKSGIYSISDLENCVLPTKIDGDDQVRKNTAIEKLNELKSSLNNYRNLIGKAQVRKELTDLHDYVAYSSSGKYAAVKNVEIYCNFPSLQDVKLQVIDLPGFGEIGAVDKVQIEGLETQVDHAMLILRPEEQTAFVGEQYANIANTLSSVQKEVKKRNNLMSVILNKKDQPGVEELTEKLRNEILRKDSNVHAGENLYEVNAIKSDDVGNILTCILNRMLSALPEMDQDFLNAYKSSIDFNSIKEQLATVQEKVRNLRKSSATEEDEIEDKAENLRVDWNESLTALQKGLKEPNDILMNEVVNISKLVKEDIENDLMYEPPKNSDENRYPDWTTWIDRTSINSATGKYGEECHRLRIKILRKYEDLNKVYEKMMNDLKTNLLSVFKQYTGSLLETDENGVFNLDDIVKKFGDAEENLSVFEDAFDWLNQQKMNFRQYVYPILPRDILELLNPDDTPFQNYSKSSETGRDADIASMKEQLTTNAKTVNECIKKAIATGDYSARFLECVVEHFTDLLIRRDEKQVSRDFKHFVREYKDYIWQSEDLSKAERDALNNLAVAIKRVIAEIDELEA